MAYAVQRGVFTGFAGGKARQNPAARRPGPLRRMFAAFMAWRQKRADRAIVDFIERSGGRLTDGLEREMTERFLTGHTNFRR
jgi:hypothetical protein